MRQVGAQQAAAEEGRPVSGARWNPIGTEKCRAGGSLDPVSEKRGELGESEEGLTRTVAAPVIGHFYRAFLFFLRTRARTTPTRSTAS